MQAFQLFLNMIPFVVVALFAAWGVVVYRATPPKFRIIRAVKTNHIHVQVSKLGIMWEFVQDQGEDRATFLTEDGAYEWCDNERKRWHATRAKKQQKYTVLRELDAAHPFTKDHSGYESR